jgi:hypothetical protein
LVIASALAITTVANGATAQTIASRVNAVRDGSVQMTFATRPGVCGDGHGSITMHNGDGSYGYDSRNFRCVVGPMLVTIGRADGQTVSIRQCVACRPSTSDATTLGDVPPIDAARYLLSIAAGLGGRNADDAIAAAALADADNLAPEIGRIIRDDNATLQSRKQALFWLGKTTASTQDLVALDGSLKSFALREQYTFVLSQRRDDTALNKLMDIALHDSDIETRKRALFWIGQSHDPRALQFFKDILRR